MQIVINKCIYKYTNNSAVLIKNEHRYCVHCLIILHANDLLYWHTQKKRLISGKMNSYKGFCEKNLSALVTTCWQLMKLHFSIPKMLDFLILNWDEQLMETEQLTDCGLI